MPLFRVRNQKIDVTHSLTHSLTQLLASVFFVSAYGAENRNNIVKKNERVSERKSRRTKERGRKI